MKVCLSIMFFLLCLQFNVFGQKNYLINIDQLNTRLKKGRDTTFIINFWATWCGPCVKELPNFEKLNNRYKAEKVKVLLISVDFKSHLNSAMIPFIKRRKIMNEVFLLDEKNQQEYIDRIDPGWSGSIPATLFVRNNTRKFIEKDFTYPELLQEYQTFK